MENNDEDDDIKYQQLKDKIEVVKDTVANNIQLVVDRGNNIEQIVQDTEDLSSSSQSFYRTSRSLKLKLWLTRIKYGGLIFIIILLLVGILVILVCGINLNKCK